VKVDIPCTCPPKANGEPRHDHDTVTFRDRLDFRGGMVIRKAITMLKVEDPDSGAAEVLAAMSEHYMLEGISGWTLVDDKGKPVEADKSAIRAFINDHQDIVFDSLVDEADNLYAEQVLLPLVRRAQPSSPTSPTEPSTSAPIGSEAKPRKPSRRCSTSTTPTAAITSITPLPDGDSSTSRRSA
jgi:hypothetical protein